jgi:hypothetical protein
MNIANVSPEVETATAEAVTKPEGAEVPARAEEAKPAVAKAPARARTKAPVATKAAPAKGAKTAPKASPKPAEKPAAKAVEKTAKPTAPKSTKPATKSAKPATKSAKPVAKVAAPAKEDTQAAVKAKKSAAKKPVAKKPKLVRDSFTFPEGDYDLIAALKQRALAAGREVKKSEVLRAGLVALAAMKDASLLKALDSVERIKTGRPAK